MPINISHILPSFARYPVSGVLKMLLDDVVVTVCELSSVEMEVPSAVVETAVFEVVTFPELTFVEVGDVVTV
jgi:hypothetical protein